MAFQTHRHAAHCPSWVSCPKAPRTTAMQHSTVAHTHRNSELLFHYTRKSNEIKFTDSFHPTSGQYGMAAAGSSSCRSLLHTGLVACFPCIPRGSFYHPLSRLPQGAHLCCCRSLRLQNTSRRGPPANKHRTSALQMHTACLSSKHSPQVIYFLAKKIIFWEGMLR